MTGKTDNQKTDNWFTEKVIDCFQTKTIPIYIGCPNIDKYFDTRGMIICNNINDLIQKTIKKVELNDLFDSDEEI